MGRASAAFAAFSLGWGRATAFVPSIGTAVSGRAIRRLVFHMIMFTGCFVTHSIPLSTIRVDVIVIVNAVASL